MIGEANAAKLTRFEKKKQMFLTAASYYETRNQFKALENAYVEYDNFLNPANFLVEKGTF